MYAGVPLYVLDSTPAEYTLMADGTIPTIRRLPNGLIGGKNQAIKESRNRVITEEIKGGNKVEHGSTPINVLLTILGVAIAMLVVGYMAFHPHNNQDAPGSEQTGTLEQQHDGTRVGTAAEH